MGHHENLRGRFAPTPSGRMHLGNLFAALLAWLDIRSLGGEMLLRMEDLDQDRCRLEYAHILAEDLSWLGLNWDFGWKPGNAEFLQSKRTEQYEKALMVLQDQELIYPCYCNRKERLAANAPHASDGTVLYSGHCRAIGENERHKLESSGRRAALRVRVPHVKVSVMDGNYGCYAEWLDESCGDFILRRSDGVHAYQLAVVVDDAEMGVSRVVRGRDLLSSTPRQIWLFEKLGYSPPLYSHTPLLTDSIGRRLSKREQDLDMEALRKYTTPERVVGFLAYRAGIIDRMEAVSARDLVSEFSWGKVSNEDKTVGESIPLELLQKP